MSSSSAPCVVLFDVDGTLVDSNYQNALAWFRAFRDVGLVVPVWRIHRHLGMGGDQLVSAVAGRAVEERVGDDLRALWEQKMAGMVDEVSAFAGAHDLLQACAEAGFEVILASSGNTEHLDHYLDLLEARPWLHAWTSGSEVPRTKPYPDLIHLARERSSGGPAAMVGDTPWDVEAASRAGVSTVAVLGGGFSRSELTDAGAALVVEDLVPLARQLDLLRAVIH